MLVEIAIADAYGAGFEYAPPTPDRPNDAAGYARHPRHHGVKPGMYTDDAQASLAVASCLLEGGRRPEDFAAAMVAAFKRDPREGYARGFQAFLEGVKDGVDFLARIRPDSDKSGAAMRAGPVGLLGSIAEVLEVAAVQARITHDTPGGVGAAQGAALMVFHQARRLGPVADVPEFLARHVPAVDWRRPHRGPAQHAGEEIARAALGVLLRSRSLKEILLSAVDQGGDTDTVAAIAMAPASVSPFLARDLPAALIDDLENGPWGREALAMMDRRLAAAFNVSLGEL